MATRLISFEFDNMDIEITPKYIPPETHGTTYTVVVGKNGIGKSRLLSEIANASFILNWHEKVIAVSTSPFDKFPSQRKRNNTPEYDKYRYVGMRSEGIYSASSAVSLISSAAKGLLEKLAESDGNYDLQPVFDSLNFHPKAVFVLKPGYLKTSRGDYEIGRVEGSSLAIELRRLDREHNIQIEERYFGLLENLPFNRRLEVFQSMVTLNKILTKKRAIELFANFKTSSLHLEGQLTEGSHIRAILVLMEAGLMRLMDLRLVKNGFGEMSLKKASSGEQCLLVLILGIAGHITNGALVMIDEPEISLHPRWQEEFMMLLTSSFSGYRECQFIIATHSPQVISRLRGQGCYIASLTQKALYSAEDFHDKSADFQLAELFDAPGIMNEYISRLAFNLLAKVKHSKQIDTSARNELNHLLKLDQQLEESDPVKELIRSISMLCESYAKN